MIICRTLSEWQEYRSGVEGTLGFVPTMGGLHAGHLALVKRAKHENTHTAVSIFVNPTQFNDREDFAHYPRDLDTDLERVQGLADVVFCPTTETLYPKGARTFVEVEELSHHLLGAVRAGHFRGVATVVTKLLNIVQPKRAYFGLKDYQQLMIIRRLVASLFIPTEIVGHPTVREPDGLAMSSRNARLSEQERTAAVILSKALEYARGIDWQNVAFAEGQVRDYIAQEALAQINQIAFCDADTLGELTAHSNAGVLLLAVTFGNVLLIDQEVYGLRTPS